MTPPALDQSALSAAESDRLQHSIDQDARHEKRLVPYAILSLGITGIFFFDRLLFWS